MKRTRQSHPFIWLFALLAYAGMGQMPYQQDSILLARQDSIALKIYLWKPDSSIQIAYQILNKTLALNNQYLEGRSYYILSKANWAKANYRLSTEYGFKALKI